MDEIARGFRGMYAPLFMPDRRPGRNTTLTILEGGALEGYCCLRDVVDFHLTEPKFDTPEAYAAAVDDAHASFMRFCELAQRVRA